MMNIDVFLTEISLPDVSNPCLAYYGRLFHIPTLAHCCQMLTSLSFFGIGKEKILVTMMVVVILFH